MARTYANPAGGDGGARKIDCGNGWFSTNSQIARPNQAARAERLARLAKRAEKEAKRAEPKPKARPKRGRPPTNSDDPEAEAAVTQGEATERASAALLAKLVEAHPERPAGVNRTPGTKHPIANFRQEDAA
jgi:hypothetical protein